MFTAMKLTFLLSAFIATSVHAQYSYQWTRYTDGPTHQSDSAAMSVLDESGNVYCLGTTGDDWGGQNADFVVTKHNPQGNLVWTWRLNADGNSQDIAADLVYKNGFVYVCGRVSRPTNWYADSDFSTTKVRADNGTTVWQKYYSGTFNPGLESSVDGARALAVDEAGNVYVTGFTWEWDYYFSNADYRTVKYSPNGDLLWSTRYHGGATYIAVSDQAYLIEVLPDGNIAVSGDSPGPNNSSEWATIKYDAATGSEIWVQRSSDANTNIRSAVPTTMKIASNGDVFVAGGGFNDATAIIRYDLETGDPIWTWSERVGHMGLEGAFDLSNNDDPVVGVTYDPDADDSNLNNNTRLIRFRASDGLKLWTRDYGNSVYGNYEVVRAIESLPDGRTIIAGIGPQTPYNWRLLLLQYSANGTLEWSYIHTPEPKVFEVRQVTHNFGGSIYVFGHATGDTNTTDLALLKFTKSKFPTSIGRR
ncbi:MAG: hypothetical protein U0R49_00505 [Fimbriimonadales bacterium]